MLLAEICVGAPGASKLVAYRLTVQPWLAPVRSFTVIVAVPVTVCAGAPSALMSNSPKFTGAIDTVAGEKLASIAPPPSETQVPVPPAAFGCPQKPAACTREAGT